MGYINCAPVHRIMRELFRRKKNVSEADIVAACLAVDLGEVSYGYALARQEGNYREMRNQIVLAMSCVIIDQLLEGRLWPETWRNYLIVIRELTPEDDDVGGLKCATRAEAARRTVSGWRRVAPPWSGHDSTEITSTPDWWECLLGIQSLIAERWDLFGVTDDDYYRASSRFFEGPLAGAVDL